MLPEFLKIYSHRAIWTSTAVATILVVIWLGTTVEAETFLDAIGQVGTATLLLVILCFILNGLLEAAWLGFMIGAGGDSRSVFRIVAWHLLGSSLLPARLGDLAWMYLIRRWLRISAGRAVFVGLYHRLQDLIVTSLLFVMSIIILGSEALDANAGLLAALVLGPVIAIIFWLEHLMTFAGLLLRRLDQLWDHIISRVLLRQTLQVRLWYRHGLSRSVLWLTFGTIVVRWLAILLGLFLLIGSITSQLSSLEIVFLANAYIYLSIIPLQAIGGLGVGEAGLAWLLTLYGLTAGEATAVSLLIWVLSSVVHIAIWLVIISVLQLIGGSKATKSNS